ncbi:site-specific integrase [Arthrobacter sp. zg-Y40]|uniref:tyrosine-type recombinase/integrase n=1 Tax=Arthrobacter sp. zg-Y40 TaxID=2886939 RepID=UPI001D152EB8|nr:tyrosine-type recombinase/integrase [Arthrobacter sp. zg-Y40]MCC3280708.1 site-specific integrase [Arthrobacter sp. zg-Y40]
MAMKERQGQGRQPDRKLTLGEVAGMWLASIEPAEVVVDDRGDQISGSSSGRIRRQTWDQYESILRLHISPALGALPIREVRTSTCDAFLRSLTVDGRGSSNARIGKTVLRQMMSYAIRHDLYVESNPVAEVDRIPRKVVKPRALDTASLEAIREAVSMWRAEPGLSGPRPTSTLSDIIDVLLGTGARIGEVLALRWQDVDMSGDVGKVSITGTIVEPRKGSKYRQGYTKTSAGVRVVPVPRFVVDVLLRRSIESPTTNGVGAVFWSRRGTYMQGSSVRRSLRSALKAAGIDPTLAITPHSFRRTVATLIDREITDGAAAELLGHSNVDVTHKHYIEKLREVGDYRDTLQQLAGRHD